MTKHGIRFYGPKDRRRIRRQNHIARDLRTPKYRQRVVVEVNKEEPDKYWDYEDDFEPY
jgi:hypothetical protein